MFKDANYLGSNMNMFVETLAVILQQIQFTFSLSTSEASWSNAQLFESMAKLSSILNYRVSGKQTSMLPVTITITKPLFTDNLTALRQFTIPRFLQVTHNKTFVLKDEINISLEGMSEGDTKSVNSVLFQGSVTQSPIFTSIGDEFENFVIKDDNIGPNGGRFISDNFFAVYVDESPNGTGDWHNWTETLQIF